MNFNTTVLLSFSIIIPVIIGLVRLHKINKAYYPFIICLSLGLLNEITSFFLVHAGYYNTVNCNMYMFIEASLLLWQFRKWGLFSARMQYILLAALAFVWSAEILVIFSITRYASWFLMIYSSLITVLSVFQVNKLLARERKKLFRNPVFIICAAFLLYYPFSVLSEAFWLYGLGQPAGFSIRIHWIAVLTNFMAILLYILAILWMPNRQKFTLPSS